jgi:hypothetical protein
MDNRLWLKLAARCGRWGEWSTWAPIDGSMSFVKVPHPPQGAGAPAAGDGYRLTRFVLLRLLGAVYGVAFLAAALQLVPLVGAHGLLPVSLFLDRVSGYYGPAAAFWHLPSLFWFNHADTCLQAVGWTGVSLSLLVVAGFANGPIMALLWILYLSIVHVGQEWYGYGWESQLLETGFLGIFLCPLWDGRPFSDRAVPLPVIWLFRWLIFRIMLGAGLIKLRGDVVWRDLTALYYHFETQPLPNPLSRWFHFLPHGVLQTGVVFNHLAELVAPLFVFWPRPGRIAAGIVIVLFQLTLIFSGNLSFLNWLTIVPALACFDDACWRWLPYDRGTGYAHDGGTGYPWRRHPTLLLCCLIGALSVQPVLNLISGHQIMNTSFEPFELVNTYGAFGSVGTERRNVVFEGTDALVPDEHAIWHPYLYRDLPVELDRRPAQVAPYQPRLDWAMWFAAMGSVQQYPWTLHVIWKLLHNDPGTLSLFGGNPFPAAPPRYIRATLYRYQFVRSSGPHSAYWTRTALGPWLPPLSVFDRQLTGYLEAAGWLTPPAPTSSPPRGP